MVCCCCRKCGTRPGLEKSAFAAVPSLMALRFFACNESYNQRPRAKLGALSGPARPRLKWRTHSTGVRPPCLAWKLPRTRSWPAFLPSPWPPLPGNT